MFNNRTENRPQYSVMPISVYPVRRNHNHGHTFQLCIHVVNGIAFGQSDKSCLKCLIGWLTIILMMPSHTVGL